MVQRRNFEEQVIVGFENGVHGKVASDVSAYAPKPVVSSPPNLL
jgi:hypothetical protein